MKMAEGYPGSLMRCVQRKPQLAGGQESRCQPGGSRRPGRCWEILVEVSLPKWSSKAYHGNQNRPVSLGDHLPQAQKGGMPQDLEFVGRKGLCQHRPRKSPGQMLLPGPSFRVEWRSI